MMSKYDDKKSELYKTICIQLQDDILLLLIADTREFPGLGNSEVYQGENV